MKRDLFRFKKKEETAEEKKDGVKEAEFKVLEEKGGIGEKKEETEFHRVIAWNKLAELCSQLLAKGRKVYVEGRLRTTSWQTQDGTQRTSTEIVIDDMILLDSRRPTPAGEVGAEASSESPSVASEAGQAGLPAQAGPSVSTVAQPAASKKKGKTEDKGKEEEPPTTTEEVNPDDIPF